MNRDFPDLNNHFAYKINPPDSAIFFEKGQPQNFYFVQKSKHILHVSSTQQEYSVFYSDLQRPLYSVDWVERKDDPHVLEVTWNKTTYFDFNGDMIFDLKMIPCMYSENGEWKPCEIKSIRKRTIEVNHQLRVFQDGQWVTCNP